VDTNEFNTLLPTAGVLITLGTLYLTARKIQKDAEKTNKEQAAAILQSAKEEIEKSKVSILNERQLVQKEFEARLAELEQKVIAQEASVEKDLAHLRETYNGEIRNLGQKIEDLRSELRNQHTQMVSLLTKMIDKD
jgi:hypothetical protein